MVIAAHAIVARISGRKSGLRVNGFHVQKPVLFQSPIIFTLFFSVDAALDARISRLGVVTSNSGQRVLIDASTIADAVFQVMPAAWLFAAHAQFSAFRVQDFARRMAGGPTARSNFAGNSPSPSTQREL